jgi:uncharacterized protein YodC (DUF2158 family)
MTDLAIGDVVKLKSGGHDMTVQEANDHEIACIWSDGKQVRSKTFNRSLLSKSGAITEINIKLVYPDKDVEEIVAEMRRACTSADDAGFYIEDKQAHVILKRRLGPQDEARTAPDSAPQ